MPLTKIDVPKNILPAIQFHDCVPKFIRKSGAKTCSIQDDPLLHKIKLNEDQVSRLEMSYQKFKARHGHSKQHWQLRATHGMIAIRPLPAKGKVCVYHRVPFFDEAANDYDVEHKCFETKFSEISPFLTLGGKVLIQSQIDCLCNDDDCETAVLIYREYCSDHCSNLCNCVSLRATEFDYCEAMDKDGNCYPIAHPSWFRKEKLWQNNENFVVNGEIIDRRYEKALQRRKRQKNYGWMKLPPGKPCTRSHAIVIGRYSPIALKFVQAQDESTCLASSFCSALFLFGLGREAMMIFKASKSLPVDDQFLLRFHNVVAKHLLGKYLFVKPKRRFDPLRDVASLPVVAKVCDSQKQVRHCVAFLGSHMFEPSCSMTLQINKKNLDYVCGGSYRGIYWHKTLKQV